MDINNLQRTLPQSYHVDAGRIRERLQQADQGIAVDQWQGDSVNISREGRRALREKMSVAKMMEPSGDIGKLSSINSGAYGMMNDFEKVMSELGSGSVSDEFVTEDYSQADVDALKARFEGNDGAKAVYHSGGSEKQSEGVKEQAYHAFMDAVSGKNSGRLKQEKGSLNQFRLDLGISPSARNALNGIWDYYANFKDKNA